MDPNQSFYKVFHNIVLFNLIYKYVRLLDLYERNKEIEFIKLKDLQEYREKRFIKKLIYYDEIIKIGDLPKDGILNYIEFKSPELSLIKGEVIPHGVEKIKYYYYLSDIIETTQLSTLPSTIHTVKNIVINPSSQKRNDIPPNITSISFLKCPNISGNNGCMVLPNTIKKLKFDNRWNNESLQIRACDIPDSVTSLIMNGYASPLLKGVLPNSIKKLELGQIWNKQISVGSFPKSLTSLSIRGFTQTIKEGMIPINVKELAFGIHWNNGCKHLKIGDLPKGLTSLKIIGYNQIKSLKKFILPNAIKHLSISCIQGLNENYYSDNLFDFLPSNIESLKINLNCNLTPNSNLFQYTSINKLIISILSESKSTVVIQPNSLPSSIKYLKIINLYSLSAKKIIPNGVENLELMFHLNNNTNHEYILKESIPNSIISLKTNIIIENPIDSLPFSITNLIIFGIPKNNLLCTSLTKMLSKLPPSLTSITLPHNFSAFNLQFPSSVKVNYE